MKLLEALALVINLAEQNVIEDEDMQEEADEQNLALTRVQEAYDTLKNQSAVDLGPKAMKAEYREECQRVATELCNAIDLADETSLSEQIETQIHEYTNTHDWLANDARLVQILNYSDHPCYEIFHHGVKRTSEDSDFPFRDMAAGAFQGDL